MADSANIEMQDLAKNLSPTSNLKGQYVPLEQRESNNLKMWDFVKDVAPIFIIGHLSAAVGYFLGKSYEGKNLSIVKIPVNRTIGSAVLGTVGGLFGVYQHWKKKEGKQLGVSAISSDLKTVISSEQLEKETKKEQEIIDGIKALQEMPKSPKSYVEDVTSRRASMVNNLGKA